MMTESITKRILKSSGNAYFVHVPTKVTESTPLFVTVHGWSRNAEEHATRFLPYAEKYGAILVAPLFDAKRSPQYQRLANKNRHLRADHILDSIIEEVEQLAGQALLPFRLFGFSGGGQFAHRYAMAYPERVARLALGAPGWYTFPDPAEAYPWGIGSRGLPADLSLEPSRFLRIPTRVFVGELDTRQSHHLNTSRSINRLQGHNRLERAGRWVKAMSAAARACGYPAAYSLELLPDSNHSFRRCMEKGGLGKAVFAFLFGSTTGDKVEMSSEAAKLRQR